MNMIWEPYLSYKLPQVTTEDCKNLERVVGHKLPEAYWEIVKLHQGQCPEPGTFIIPGTGAQEQVGVLLHIFSQSRVPAPRAQMYGVISQYKNMKRLYHPDVVPFSNDTGGNRVAFDFRSGTEPSVVFANHNFAGDYGLSFVAPNFTALLKMLALQGRATLFT